MANTKITELTQLTNPVSTDVLPIVDVGADVTKKISIADLLKNASTGTAEAPGIAFDGDTNTGIYSPGADQLAISTNGTGRLFVDASGNVEVRSGTLTLGPVGGEGGELTIRNTTNTATVYALDASTDTNARLFTTNNNCNLQIGQLAGTGGIIQLFTSASEQMRLDSSGRLGLGTSSPSQILGITTATNDDGIILTNSSANGGRIRLESTGTGGRAYHINVTADGSGAGGGKFVIRDNTASDAARLTIDSSGNVGIGTTAPNTLLHVAGNATIGAADANPCAIELGQGATGNRTSYIDLVGDTTYTDYGFRFQREGGANGASIIVHRGTGDLAIKGTEANNIVFSTSDTERARIDSSGRLLVGTSSDSGGALLQVNGDRVRIATAKTPASASDTGTTGEICWDANYIYVCTATNTWKRSAISTW